jgi:serine phosphatase RsbU (regulator of sigma subunit)
LIFRVFLDAFCKQVPIFSLFLHILMGLVYITYSYAYTIYGGSIQDGLSDLTIMNSAPSPYRFILYSAIVIAFAYLVIMSQTGRLIKTRKLLKEKEKALEVIARQKIELEIREKSITESLIYAQRIQEALLPSETYFKKHFKDSFIFFKPKDIVSGDFYWIDEKGDKVYVVAADCTGHGVPGALMSMIGLEIIERAINDDNIVTPSLILEVLNRGLEKTFSREKNIGTIIRDGMDIGLCVVDKKRKKLVYGGAFFNLYLIRNNSLIEIRGDKIIIGMNPEGISYTDNELDLQEDDIIYIFSDGYVDQFGGSENKKFMYRRFRYLLLTIHRFPIYDQKSILDENIRTWMGRNPQVDDILVIGFRPLYKEP